MTSELSNALNPYASQSRARNLSPVFSSSLQPVLQPPSQYVPHRSELELAISEPPPPLPPAPPPRTVATRPKPSTEGVHAVQELLRIVSATREAQETERKRRLEWEQQQEEKQAQLRAETEREMFELRQTVLSLQSTLKQVSGNTSPSIAPPLPSSTSGLAPHIPTSSGLFTPHSQFNMSPALPEQSVPQPASPVSPVSQAAPYAQQPTFTFIQGSSTRPLPSHQSYYRSPAAPHHLSPPPPEPQSSPQSIPIIEHGPQSVTPSPSPQLTFIEVSQSSRGVAPLAGKRKRASTQPSSDDDDGNTSSSSAASGKYPLQRVSHHDKRILTIQHAMRLHILQSMDVDTDKELPDSHREGAPLGATDPVRFVWDKTTKQSVHNSRMKSRIIADIKDKRRMYKYVPSKDFGKKQLDSAFESSFTTFRSKFKAQRDAATALNQKKREEAKGRKSRHLSRRKTKLTNRAEARLTVQAYEHVGFDGALQLDCMSSEESDFELDDPPSPRPAGLLQTRGYAWRSTRLIQFFCTLDDEERMDKSGKPKRGVGKKERYTGPPKEGFSLPPQGVASWMISKRWYKSSLRTHPDLPDALQKLVDDPPGFDWSAYRELGEETGDEEGPPPSHNMQSFDPHHNSLAIPQHHYTTSTSSLNYALV